MPNSAVQHPEQQFTPGEVAALVAIPSHTVRRWAQYHAVHLSPGSHPPPGQPRRFTRRDVEVLRAAKALHAQGFTVPVVNERLYELAIGEIDTNVDSAAIAPAAQEAPGTTEEASQVISYLAAVEERTAQRLANVERRQKDIFTAFAAGVIVAALFFGIIVLIAWIYGG